MQVKQSYLDMPLCKVSYSVDFPSLPFSFSFLTSSSRQHSVHDLHHQSLQQFLPDIYISVLIARYRNVLRLS